MSSVTQNTTLNTTTTVSNTTLQQTSSPDITTVFNTLYNRTSWTPQKALSLDHLPIITTMNIRHNYRLQQNRRTFTNYKKADWTQFTEDTESAFAQATILTNIIFTNIILMADKHNQDSYIYTGSETDTHAHCIPGRVAWRIDLSKQWENSL